MFSKPALFFLYGDLGSGKTTFVKQLVALVNENEQVTSPTYSLINDYSTGNLIVHHIDLYRLNTTEEALEIGIEDAVGESDYCFIEWPQLVEKVFSESVIKLYFSHIEGERTLRVEAP